ncbi:hypothetical protein P7C65_03s3g03440 [Encephalitozoon intestinalis]|nr:hypothetical protein GPK93_03g03700 [Encephalitozoon intestinalis]
MPEGIKSLFEGQEVFVVVDDTKVRVRKEEISTEGNCKREGIIRDIPLIEIRSLHVKNDEGFFLKLRLLEETIIFKFDSHHSRDIIKSMILSFMKTDQDVIRKILESDPAVKTMFNNLKQCISSSKFWTINKDRMRQMMPIVRQQPSREIEVDEKTFISSLDPVLLNIFGQMNCSVNQFYNLLRQSYFCNTKNEKNSLDRMINSAVRDYEVRQDFASRINTHSVLALKPIEDVEIRPSTKEGRKVEFLPIYPFEEEKPEKPRREFRFDRHPLKCELDLEIVPMTEKKMFEKKDLVWIRDLSKVVYKSMKEEDGAFLDEVSEITKRFLDNMERKYGKGCDVYLKRILPTYFIEGKNK